MRHFAILLAPLALISPRVTSAQEPAEAAVVEEERIEIFAPPVDWYGTAPRGQVIQVVSQVRQLLKEDWTSQSSTVEKVVPRYVTVHAVCPTDGRLPFAWGLYFWKAGDRTKARSAFAKSVTLSPRFLAGHQAVAYANFDLGDPDRGLESLENLLNALREPADAYPSENQKLQAAEWLGQAAGYLRAIALTREQTDRLSELDRRLGALPEDLRNAGARGRQKSLDRIAEFKAILALPEDQLQANFREQLFKTTEQLEVCEKRIGELARDKQRNADEVSAANQEQARTDLTIRQLTVQISSHVSKANSLERSSYGEKETEHVPEYETKEDKNGRKSKVLKGYKTVTKQLPETNAETARRIADIQAQRSEALAKQQTKLDLQAQLNAQLNQRKALTNEAAKFTSTVAAEWDALQAQQRQLKQLLSSIESWQLDPQKFTTYARTVDPYVVWDVEGLRVQLLDSMKLPEAAPPRIPPAAVPAP